MNLGISNLSEATQIIISKLNGWLEKFIVMLPNFVLAVVLIIIFTLIARLVKNLVEKLLGKFSSQIAINRLIANVVYFSIIFLGVFVALGLLKLDKTVTSLLAGAGIIGLALSFAFQDTAANIIAGVILAVRRPLTVHDWVKVKDFYGTVERINLRTTVMRTVQGQMIIIPNKSILENPIENFTLSTERRIDLRVGISYGEDLQNVKDITLKAIEGIDHLKKDKGINFFYEEFGDSSINFVIMYWISFGHQLEYKRAVSDGIMAIKKAYDEYDILIPFPIRTLDFGIKGGEKLNEVWPDKPEGNSSALKVVEEKP